MPLAKPSRAKKILTNTLQTRLKTDLQQNYASLGLGHGLAESVKVPVGENKNEWIAVHVVDFVNGVDMLYSSLNEVCTASKCPTMNAGHEYEYLWRNKKDKNYKKPTAVSAPQYISLLMDWIESYVNDETVFPKDANTPFPKDFLKIVKDIFKRLFRVYAHMFCAHLNDVKKLGEHAHLNTSFKHFMYFVFEFDLISGSELAPLREVIVELLGPQYESKIPK